MVLYGEEAPRSLQEQVDISGAYSIPLATILATCCGLRQLLFPDVSFLPFLKVLAYSSLQHFQTSTPILSYHFVFSESNILSVYGNDSTGNMDVTAFETQAADGLTWDEVMERIPQGIRTPVSSFDTI